MIQYSGDKKVQLALFNHLIQNFEQDSFNLINIQITQEALAYILDKVKPICSLDFVGYLFPIYQRKNIKVNGMLDLYGNVRIYSGIENQQISSKLLKKVLKKLLKTNFIILSIEPFPEFESYYNVPIDPERTVFIDKPIFKNYLTEEQLEEMRKLYDQLEAET